MLTVAALISGSSVSHASPNAAAPNISFGTGLNKNDQVTGPTTTFTVSSHFAWRAPLRHAMVGRNLTRLTLTSKGKLLDTVRPFKTSRTLRIALGDQSMKSFMADNNIPGKGAYLMWYIRSEGAHKGELLAQGTFTIK
jgi:hypothetical protein